MKRYRWQMLPLLAAILICFSCCSAGSSDDGGLPLEDALKLFEEGTGLVRLCDGKLRDARLKVETLSQGLEPKPQEVSEA